MRGETTSRDVLLEAARADHGTAVRVVEVLLERNDRLTEKLDGLARQVTELREKLEVAEREGKRQAAPFRQREKPRVAKPKKPGRKKGHPGTCRPIPPRADTFVEAPLAGCPECGGLVTRVRPKDQYIEDIPPVTPIVTQVRTSSGHREKCGRASSRHPCQVSTGSGAARAHLGPRAQAIAPELLIRRGLSTRATAQVLRDFFGLRITAGGLVHLEDRLAGRLQSDHQALGERLRKAPVVHADETSWWVGGPGWWLWVFTTDIGTLYRVRDSQSREVIREPCANKGARSIRGCSFRAVFRFAVVSASFSGSATPIMGRPSLRLVTSYPRASTSLMSPRSCSRREP
jgi:transposase